MSISQSTARRTGRIVVGVDGSPASAQALRWAAAQSGLTGAELEAVIAWKVPDAYTWGPVLEDVDWAADADAALTQTLTETLGEAEAGRVHRSVVRGNAAQVLLDTAEGADMLVVGCRGHGGFTGMLLGSVSHHVIAHAPCAVLVVHDETPLPASATG